MPDRPRSSPSRPALLATALSALFAAGAGPAVDYNRQVRPILSNTCYKCHGPDAEEREAELRLDLREAALAPAESGEPAIVPGKPDASTLVARVFSTKRGTMMPPPKSNKTLSDEEKRVLRDWVAQGAPYQSHWSFEPPVRHALPAVKRAEWVRNPIDRFVLARFKAEGLRSPHPRPTAPRWSAARPST